MANFFKWWVKFKVIDRKKKKTWVTDAIILTRGLNQGRIKRLWGPGQLTIFRPKPDEEQKKSQHVRRCPSFRQHRVKSKKKVITSAHVQVSAKNLVKNKKKLSRSRTVKFFKLQVGH